MRATVRYSEAFKLQVLRELDEGRFRTRAAAARAYGIRGQATIEYWARKYEKQHLLGKVIRVETPKEVSEVKELRRRVRNLEKALADAHLKGRSSGESCLSASWSRVTAPGYRSSVCLEKTETGRRPILHS